MTAAEKLYQLIQTLPEDQINQILDFAEFLHHKEQITSLPQAIPPATLTGLRGIIKHQKTSNDQQLQAD